MRLKKLKNYKERLDSRRKLKKLFYQILRDMRTFSLKRKMRIKIFKNKKQI